MTAPVQKKPPNYKQIYRSILDAMGDKIDNFEWHWQLKILNNKNMVKLERETRRVGKAEIIGRFEVRDFYAVTFDPKKEIKEEMKGFEVIQKKAYEEIIGEYNQKIEALLGVLKKITADTSKVGTQEYLDAEAALKTVEYNRVDSKEHLGIENQAKADWKEVVEGLRALMQLKPNEVPTDLLDLIKESTDPVIGFNTIDEKATVRPKF